MDEYLLLVKVAGYKQYQIAQRTTYCVYNYNQINQLFKLINFYTFIQLTKNSWITVYDCPLFTKSIALHLQHLYQYSCSFTIAEVLDINKNVQPFVSCFIKLSNELRNGNLVVIDNFGSLQVTSSVFYCQMQLIFRV